MQHLVGDEPQKHAAMIKTRGQRCFPSILHQIRSISGILWSSVNSSPHLKAPLNATDFNPNRSESLANAEALKREVSSLRITSRCAIPRRNRAETKRHSERNKIRSRLIEHSQSNLRCGGKDGSGESAKFFILYVNPSKI